MLRKTPVALLSPALPRTASWCMWAASARLHAVASRVYGLNMGMREVKCVGGGCRACTLTWPLTSHSRATPCEGPQGFGPRAPIFAPSATDRPLHHPSAPLGPWLHAARSFLACGSARSAVVRCGTPAGRKSPKATRTQRAERGARISRHSWRLQREAYASARAVLLRFGRPCPGHPREAS